ncbi:hypothetical protein BKK56_07265 [Rodentibacter genomosp. 2]|uniref:hypothetical protein n=1 Tax=Rodentibacter genomosp. 2 TaxID=1908266 RepID=UPI0009863925|nr:hypothetical protein BKK56_07265 [Rodentibacter genomosp. 2]
MKSIIKINKIIMLSIFLISCHVSADNIDIKYYLNSDKFFSRDIDIDNDGVTDKVISSISGFGDELLFFKKDNDDYHLIFKGNNFSEDGGLNINDIKRADNKEGTILIITNTDKLNIINKYYIVYDNEKWILKAINSEVSGFLDDYSKKYICRFNELDLDISIPDIKDNLPNSDLSDEYIKNNCELSYFFENSLDDFMERFNEGDISIINGIERYKQLLSAYHYKDSTKKQYATIIDKLSKLKLIKEKDYLEKVINKKIYTTGTIINKAYLYSSIGVKTRMYLIKGNRVSILDEKIDEHGDKWYFINYKEKKEINMWIKADSVDLS